MSLIHYDAPLAPGETQRWVVRVEVYATFDLPKDMGVTEATAVGRQTAGLLAMQSGSLTIEPYNESTSKLEGHITLEKFAYLTTALGLTWTEFEIMSDARVNALIQEIENLKKGSS